jgi:hypothetical protein
VLSTAAPPARADVADPGNDPWAAVPDAVSLTGDPDAAPPKPNHDREIALGALSGIYLGFSTWAYFAWYRDHPANHGFEFGGDGLFEKTAYAGGSDKMGHAWATMVLGRMSSQVLKLGGWSPRPAALIGNGLAFGLFTLVEYADAYYYEFSVGDLVADLLGAAAAVALESSARADELFDFRVEYWPSDEYKSIVRGDPGRDPETDLKAVNIAEDYSGQTYLAALHLGAFHQLDDRRWTSPLKYVDAVIGFRSNKYRPEPLPDDMGDLPPATQSVSLGVSLNLQAVFDRVLDGGGRGRRTGKALLHGLTELMNAPFTSFRPLSTSRSCAPPDCVPDL